VTDVARLAAFAATCSIDTDTSLTDDTSCSVEVAADSAWLAVSLSDVAIWFTPLTTSSSDRICAAAPSKTASAIRAMPPAECVMRRAPSSIRCRST
jgi:hypothetical protein